MASDDIHDHDQEAADTLSLVREDNVLYRLYIEVLPRETGSNGRTKMRTPRRECQCECGGA